MRYIETYKYIGVQKSVFIKKKFVEHLYMYVCMYVYIYIYSKYTNQHIKKYTIKKQNKNKNYISPFQIFRKQ